MENATAFVARLGRQLGSLGAPIWLAWLALATLGFLALLALAGLVLPAPEPVLMAPFRW